MTPGTVPCHQEPYRFSSFSTYLFPSVALNLPKDGSDPVVNIKSVFLKVPYLHLQVPTSKSTKEQV